MVNLTISEEMIEIMASMKGKTLKSIEGNYLFESKEFSEIVRFNLGQYAVEFYVDYVAIKWFWGADYLIDDEENCFVVTKYGLNERHYPEGWKIVQFLKDEKISEVIVVRDSIKTNKGDEIISDAGFVIKTTEKVYSFSQWALGVHLNESNKIDMPLSEKDVKEQYTDEYNSVEVVEFKRDFIFL
jgi:hypothetical protein